MKSWLHAILASILSFMQPGADVGAQEGASSRAAAPDASIAVAEAIKQEMIREISLPAGIDPRVTIEDGRIFGIAIELDHAPDLFKAVEQAGFPLGGGRRDQLRRWAESLHPRMLEIVRSTVAKSGSDPDFNPETDFQLSISGQVLPTEAPAADNEARFKAAYFNATYRGSRLTYFFDGTGYEGKVPIDPDAAPAGTELTVEIAPAKSEWSLRETIFGAITFRNTGTRRIPINRWRLDDVTIVDADGKAPRQFSMRGHISYAKPNSINKFLLPGESYQSEWAIHADPLQSLVHGYILPEGEYRIGFRDLRDEYNIPTKVNPVSVQVKRRLREYAGPRILQVRSCGSNLALLRERSVVEVIDADSGRRLCTRLMPGYRHDWIWTGARSIFGPDGRFVAYCPTREPVIKLVGLYGDPPPAESLKSPPDFEVGPGGFSAKRFGKDGKTLIAATNRAYVEMDLATGKSLRQWAMPIMWSDMSPGGDYAVGTDGGMIRMVGSRGKDSYSVTIVRTDDPEQAKTIRIDGHGDSPTMLPGLRGAYLTDEFNNGALYVPYDAETPLRFDAGQASVDAESEDGSLVAFTVPGGPGVQDHAGPTTIEVWSVEKRVKLYEIPGGEERLRPMFLSNPLRLACAVETSKPGVSWFAERVKVYQALTGKFLREIDLTPASDDLGLDFPDAAPDDGL